MALQSLKLNNTSGGITTLSSKAGIDNSARFMQNVNIFEDPNFLTNSKKTTKVSGSTVDDLVHWIEDGSPWSTNRYFYAANGKIFQETSAASWSSLRTVSGGAGEGLLVHNDSLLYALATNIGRYWPLSSSPSFEDDITVWWLATDLQISGGGTGATDYTTQTSIMEGATHRQTFTPDQDPIASVVIDVDAVGTGDWTVTIHDINNNSLGSKTIVNGSMSTGDVTFTFDSVIRVIPNESYHFHVTTTVADGGVDTSSNNDLEAAEFTINFNALVDADFHPMANFFGGWAIGNERYIGFFDNVNGNYDATAVILDPGFEVRALYTYEEYLVAEAYKGQTFEEAESARRYFWDGIAITFNFFEDLKVSPNAATSYKNQLVGVYGNMGAVYEGSKPQTKVTDRVPKLARGKKVEVYPGAIDEYEERLVIGYSALTDDSALEQGVYEYGRQTDAFNNVLSFPYTISTGTTSGTSLKIGSVRGIGTDLYIGWRDDSTYGVDKVALGDSASASGSWESRTFDNGDANKTKQAIKLEITFEALTSNQTVTPKYDINRTGTFTTGTAATSGDTEANLFINSNFKEIDFGYNFASSSNTFIKITGINFIFEDNQEEGEEE